MMTPRRGRNVNTSVDVEHTVVPLNAATLTTLVGANPKRVGFTALLPPGVDPACVRVLYAPATTPDIGQARDVLVRDTMGNASLFHPLHAMPTDLIYTGEISAISTGVPVDLLVTEA